MSHKFRIQGPLHTSPPLSPWLLSRPPRVHHRQHCCEWTTWTLQLWSHLHWFFKCPETVRTQTRGHCHTCLNSNVITTSFKCAWVLVCCVGIVHGARPTKSPSDILLLSPLTSLTRTHCTFRSFLRLGTHNRGLVPVSTHLQWSRQIMKYWQPWKVTIEKSHKHQDTYSICGTDHPRLYRLSSLLGSVSHHIKIHKSRITQQLETNPLRLAK